ncbi:glycoside hydrolase domain-containing protein [Silvibacterium sp.]|uniref:glycoside hydrolase domain-containing protein n=1 Tax=Silvibacterium sp. TaxID=1964179 RepID=UPI0039E5D4BF
MWSCSYREPGWYGQYHNPYNETGLEAPFGFNFSDESWVTHRVVCRVLEENYLDTPDGIPGNDDCDEMSSWAVLSMMGFYSVDPASLAYELVSPVFSSVTIHLHAPYSGVIFTFEGAGARSQFRKVSRGLCLLPPGKPIPPEHFRVQGRWQIRVMMTA